MGTRSAMLDSLLAQGFDLSVRRGAYVTPRCSCCEAIVINGVACHESGCGNAMHECAGCWTMVPMRVRYCEDCAS